MRAQPLAVALALSVGMAAAYAAGTVDVSFVKPDEFADIGHGSIEIERNTQVLADHLKKLGARLPNGQALKLEVLDVDLAGEQRLNRRGNDLRVLRGRADWPSMTVRYTLTADGRTVRSGQERITDMNYMFGSLRGYGSDEALAYDRRMLDRWFAENFAAEQTARR